MIHLSPGNIQCYWATDHHVGHFRNGGLFCNHITNKGPFSQNSNAIGNIHYFVKFMRDDYNSLAGVAHVSENNEESVCFLRRQNGGGFVQNQYIGATIQHLNDLNGLFLRYGHIIDLLIGVDFKAIQITDLPYLVSSRFQIQFSGFVQPEDDVFRSGKDIHQLEVLMNHTDTELHGILRRTNGDFFSIDEDLSFIREVYAGEHVHQRCLAAAVFAQ